MLKNIAIKLLILFLLLSQFATVVHAIEHQFLDDEPEQCLICVHESDSKNFLFDSSNFNKPDLNNQEKIGNQAYLYDLEKLSHNNNRSPPSILV